MASRASRRTPRLRPPGDAGGRGAPGARDGAVRRDGATAHEHSLRRGCSIASASSVGPTTTECRATSVNFVRLHAVNINEARPDGKATRQRDYFAYPFEAPECR